MKCAICKNGETAKGKITVTLEKSGSIVVIKGVKNLLNGSIVPG
ncbi:MAG: hypothetical protein WCL21_03765 [Mariniphaga sp.]